MKKSKYHIIRSWLLLIFFVAGQVMVCTHQHKVNAFLNKVQQQSAQQTITEKCQFCDALHFNHIVLNQEVYFQPALSGDYIFVPDTYSFVSISLILSAGRSPPLS